MTKKTIYVIEESSGYYKDGWYDRCESSVIESYEYEDDAKLALWYWCCDQIDKYLDAEWVDDRFVHSEGDGLYEYLDRCISEVNLYS